MDNMRIYEFYEVLQILDVCQDTLLKMIRQEQIKAVKVGRRWIITDVALKEFLRIS